MSQTYSFLILFLLAISSFAKAECFAFSKGSGPRLVGLVSLAGQAEKICFTIDDEYGSPAAYISLEDSLGPLAKIVATVKAEERPNGEIQAQLGSGHANGMSIDLSGISIVVEAGLSYSLDAEVRSIWIDGTQYYGELSK